MRQEEFARRLGISRATLTRIEGAAQNTTLKTPEQTCRALRYPVGEFFGEREARRKR